MTKYLYTFDSDGAYISKDSDIMAIKADDLDEAKAAILAEAADMYELEEGESLSVTEGTFGDCWQRCLTHPKEWWNDGTVGLDEIVIQEPGTHPGGKCFWMTPFASVYVVTIEKN